MKIYIIDQCLDKVGGVERVCHTLWKKLNTKYDVHIISKTRNNDTPFFDYGNTEIEFLYDNRKGCNGFITNVVRRLITDSKIRKITKNFSGNDTVIFGRVHVALSFLPYINRLKSKPKVIVRDAIHIEYFDKVTRRSLLKYFPSNVDTFIVSSSESIKAYKDFFGETKINITKIYNPLGILPNHKFDYSSKTIVSIGRIDDDQKGYDNLIKAMNRVHAEHPDWKLQIYGDGDYKAKCIDLINDLSAHDYIKICESTKNVVEVFNKSAIFVLASRFEGYANILVEAMSCGIPSISYDWLMGVDDIIDDEKNGIIVRLSDRLDYYHGGSKEEDCVNLSNAICNLIDNEDMCNALSNESVKIIRSRNIDTIVDQWIKIIQN